MPQVVEAKFIQLVTVVRRGEPTKLVALDEEGQVWERFYDTWIKQEMIRESE